MEIECGPEERENCTFLIYQLTNQLGNAMVKIKQFHIAREIYKAVSNPDMIFKSFKQQLKINEEQKNVDSGLLL
jgi:hypothetical protein